MGGSGAEMTAVDEVSFSGGERPEDGAPGHTGLLGLVCRRDGGQSHLLQQGSALRL